MVTGDTPIRDAHHVDGVASRVLQDVADVPQGLVRCVVSAVSPAFLACGCHAGDMPFLELVAASGDERSEVSITFPSLRCAGVLWRGEVLFCGQNVMDQL